MNCFIKSNNVIDKKSWNEFYTSFLIEKKYFCNKKKDKGQNNNIFMKMNRK